MTRQDFEMIAAVLLSERPDVEPAGAKPGWYAGARDEWSTMVLAFSGRLAGTSPRFDAARFLDAAGYPHPSLR